jgi:hypothetical protein
MRTPAKTLRPELIGELHTFTGIALALYFRAVFIDDSQRAIILAPKR